VLPRSRWWTVAALALIALPLWHAIRLDHELKAIGVQEDAFIGLRHLRHFVEHGRLVYNLDTSTLGATSPLFWITSGLAIWTMHGTPPQELVLGYHLDFACTCWIATLVAFVLLARGALRVVAAAWIVAAVTVFAVGLRYMHLGLEGPFLTVSLAIVCALVHAGVRPERVLALCGVLAWDRPEIAALALPAVLVAIAVHAGPRLRCAGAFAAGWIAPPLAMLVLTGSPIPNSVRAKSFFGATAEALRAHPVQYVLDRVGQLRTALDVSEYVVPVVLALLVAATAWWAVAALRARTAFPWRLALGVFACGYSGFVLTVPQLWEWYPAFWVGFAAIALGVALHDLAARVPRTSHVAAGAAVIACAIYVAGRHGFSLARHRAITILSQEHDFRGRLGRDLDEKWHARSVWMEAVGWQGYFNDARVYDEVGLADSEVFRFAEHDGCGYFMAAMRALAPEYVIKRRFELDWNAMFDPPHSCPTGARMFLDDAARAEWTAHYREVARYDSAQPEFFGDYSHLVLFRRVD